MKLHDILEATAREYDRRKIATVRFTGHDEDAEPGLYYQGSILNKEGKPARPVGLGLVITSQPVEAVPIVDPEDEQAVKPDVVPAGLLDLLAGIVSFNSGRAGILWLNAGQPAVLAGNAIVNAARHYQLSVQRQEDGQSWKESSRRIPWTMFSPVSLAKGRRKGEIVMDWLAAAALAQSDAGEQTESKGQD